MPDLNHYLNQGLSAEDVAHSNGYGVVAGGGGAGGLSMDQRRRLLYQPRVVGAYQHSRLGRQGSAIKSRTANQHRGRAYDASSGIFHDSAVTSVRKPGGVKEQRPADSQSIDRRQRFIEPTPRNYDKYA